MKKRLTIAAAAGLMMLAFGLQNATAVEADSTLLGWANAEVARLFAEAALVEFAVTSKAPLDRASLRREPLVLAREGCNGVRVVQVAYPARRDSAYVVTFRVNGDGHLEIASRGTTSMSPRKLQERFEQPGFDPAELLRFDPPE